MSFPDNDPPPEPEWRAEMARVDADYARARRYLSALNAADDQALNALMIEIVQTGRGAETTHAMAMQALDFARALAANQLLADENNEHVSLQRWLDNAALGQLDVAVQDQQDLDGE